MATTFSPFEVTGLLRVLSLGSSACWAEASNFPPVIALPADKDVQFPPSKVMHQHWAMFFLLVYAETHLGCKERPSLEGVKWFIARICENHLSEKLVRQCAESCRDRIAFGRAMEKAKAEIEREVAESGRPEFADPDDWGFLPTPGNRAVAGLAADYVWSAIQKPVAG